MSRILDELVKTKVQVAIAQTSIEDKDMKLKILTEETLRLKEMLKRLTAENEILQRNFAQLLSAKNALRNQLEGETNSDCTETDSIDEESKSSSSAKNSGQWDTILSSLDKYRGTKKLRKLIIGGFAEEVREELWLKAVGNSLHISAGLYASLHARTRDRPIENLSKADDTHLIPLDLTRTLKTLRLPYEKQLLSDVLNIFAQYRPDVGYVQGMAYLNGVMLVHLSPVNTFTLFSNLVVTWEILFNFYTFNVSAIHSYYAIFTGLLRKKLPRVLQKFNELEITPDMFLLEWVYTLFARCFSLKTVGQLWDWLLVEGQDAVFTIAIAILQGLEKEILAGELDDIMRILNSTQEKFPDFVSLWKVLKKVKVKVSLVV